MEKEPTNLQAQSLAYLIDQKVTRGSCSLLCVWDVTLILSPLPLPHLYQTNTEGYIGMALAGGVAAIGTILLASLIRRAARK